MENRKRLHDSSLVMIIYGFVHLFMFIATMIDGFADGSLNESLATVDAEILVAVKVVLIAIGSLAAILVVADVFLGIKGMKVSKTPDASKGYITVAKIFIILTSLSIFSHVASIIGGNASTLDASLNLASATLSVCIYTMFVTAADAVRKDFLGGTK